MVVTRRGKVPQTFVTDGAPNYMEVFQKEYWNRFKYPPIHLRDIHIAGTIHNNKMERMNGEVRDREKVMRGIKTTDTPILKGIQLYHNFIRPHEGLSGDTPAERAGIKIEGDDKWLTMIQNASKKTS